MASPLTTARHDPGRPAGARPWARHAAVAGGGLALLVVSWVLLNGTDTVPAWEVGVFEAVNGLPGFLRWPLWPVMQLGTLWMYVVGGVGVYALTHRARPALATASAVLLAWIVARIVKDVVARGRPVDLLDDVTLRQSNPDGYGFVSGHTSVAFGLATALTVVLPGRWRWVPLPVAVIVGVSRVHFGVHLPLDVLGGAGVGLLCGTVAVVAFSADISPEPEAGNAAPPPGRTEPSPGA